MLRIGIIGATGYIGQPYRSEIRHARQGATIVGLCARRLDRLQQAQQQDQAEFVTQDWREIVEHPGIDLVLVLTPDALHFEPVMACVGQGKDVFCEKPIGVDAAQAKTLYEHVKRSGVRHFVPFWTRFVPAVQRLKQLIHSRQLGDIRVVVYRWHNPRPPSMPFTWRDDAALSAAGSIADVGSHAYDTLRFLLGVEAERVLCDAAITMKSKPDLGPVDLAEALALSESSSPPVGQRRREATTFDFAQMLISFPDGMRGCVIVSHSPFLRKGFAPELEIHGTAGSAAFNRATGQIFVADSPRPAELLQQFSTDDRPNRFQEYVFPALLDPLQCEPDRCPNLRDGWLVQSFTDAAVASARRGGWVDLTEFR